MRRCSWFLPVVLAAASALAAGCSDDDDDGPAPDAGPITHDAAVPNCTLALPDPEAERTAGPHPEGGHLLIGGRRITPHGQLAPLAGYPMNVKVLPGGEHLIVTESGWRKPHQLFVVDAVTGDVLDTESPGRFWFGIAPTADGSTVYVGGGGSRQLYVYDFDRDLGQVDLRTSVDLGTVFVGAVTLTPDEDRLLVLDNEGRDLIVLDASSLEVLAEVVVGDMPYDVVVDAARDQAVVSLWGDSEVVFVDLGSYEVIETLPVGKNPEAMVLGPDGDLVYVVESDSSSFSAVDLATRQVAEVVEVDIWHASLRGINPNHLAITPDNAYLLVSAGGTNSVEVYDRVTLDHVGSIPTAWYPTGIAVAPTGDFVYIANAKGVGAGPSAGESAKDLMAGNVQIAPMPSAAELAAFTEVVRENNERMERLEPALTCTGEPRIFPVPPEPGLPTPIEHVVLLIRENKTYDAHLGDLGDPEAAGDPDLTIYGEEITPNLHALARRFANLDNYYVPIEVSLQGHQWLTTVMNNDYFEKTIPVAQDEDGTRSLAGYVTGDIGVPESGFVWSYLQSHGVDFIDYGEGVGVPQVGLEILDQDFPGILYNLAEPDVNKAAYVAQRVADGFMPTFTYLLLPNNHTYGGSPGRPTPESMVADNDQATGMVVDAISHSPFWPRTAIFIVEDDPQQGGDHVEIHRSSCIVVSPWARRGVVHVNHDMASLWKTIFHILGLPPIGYYDATAGAMYDAFTDVPDFAPYTYIERRIPEAWNPTTGAAAYTSLRMDFSLPDQAEGLPRLIWQMIRGEDPPWPEAPKGPFEIEDEDGDGDRDDD